MKSISQKRREARIRRHARVRLKVSGTAECPRLSVFRSVKHITAQLHNDLAGKCLLTVTSYSPEVRAKLTEKSNKTAVSAVVGELLAEKAKASGIAAVCFDRGGYLYHGRVKALAEGARKGGLQF